MKNTFKVLGIIAFIAIIGLSFASCGDDDDSSSSVTYDPVEYKSSRGDTAYSLKITKNEGKAAFTPSNGDFYTLTITTAGVSQTSNGTISISGNTFTLTHTATGASFTVTISGGEMTSINGTIPTNNGETVPAPGVVTPEGGGGGDDGSLGATLTISDEQVFWEERNWETGETTYIPIDGYDWGFKYVRVSDNEILLLSEVIDVYEDIIIMNGKLSFSFGTPKASAPNMIELFKMEYPGITISPSDTKSFILLYIINSDNFYNSSTILHQNPNEKLSAFYWYSDKNVTINGTHINESKDDNGNIQSTFTNIFALDLKTGWNSVIITYSITGDDSYEQLWKNGKPAADYQWIMRRTIY
jgi:hypothetical protein